MTPNRDVEHVPSEGSSQIIHYQFDQSGVGGGASILKFQGALKEQLLEHYQRTFAELGRYSTSSRAVSSQTGKSIAMAVGGAGVSVAANRAAMVMYMPTVPPSLLTPMADGGLSTMIHGSTGIVAHASFMPVPLTAGVVPPLAAMQVMQTAAVMREFRKLEGALKEIENRLTTLLMRDFAEDIGILDAAMTLLDELYAQYELCGAFSADALNRLAQVEFHVTALLGKYSQLTDGNTLTPDSKAHEIDESILNMRQRLLLSFVQMRTAHLRVSVNMQENPAYVERSAEVFLELARMNIDRWKGLLHRSEEIERLEEENGKGYGWFVSKAKSKDENQHCPAYVRTLKAERELLEEFTPLITRIEDFLLESKSSEHPGTGTQALVYGRTEDGDEFSFYTSELPDLIGS